MGTTVQVMTPEGLMTVEATERDVMCISLSMATKWFSLIDVVFAVITAMMSIPILIILAIMPYMGYKSSKTFSPIKCGVYLFYCFISCCLRIFAFTRGDGGWLFLLGLFVQLYITRKVFQFYSELSTYYVDELSQRKLALLAASPEFQRSLF